MIGKITWNFVLGAVALLFTFLLNIGSNLFLTSLVHSVYAFVCAFLLGFVLRYALGTFAGLKQMDALPEEHALKGQHIDLSTPTDESQPVQDEAAAADSGNLQPEADEEFVPLTLQSLPKEQTDPEELTKAVRHMASKP